MRQKFSRRQGMVLARTARIAGFLAASALALITLLNPGAAQQLPADLLQQFQRQQGLGLPAVPGQNDAQFQQPLLLQPAIQQPMASLPPSRLEQIFSARAGVQLRQFGYEQLGRGAPVAVPQAGAVQDNYILGSGDEIVVSLRGQENNEIRSSVDRNGQVVLPRLNPIPAAGRSFGTFRQDVESAVSRAYVATTAFVSVGRVRQISVLVSGEVNNPGQRVVTGLTSVVDAILLSGGIRKSGSLRNVRLVRGGRETVVDLYSILSAGGRGADMRLADGDRIRVPLVGAAVAVAGLVRQPAIFELPAGQKTISVANLMALAGGEEVRGGNRLSLLQYDAGGRSRLVQLSGPTGSVGDSEILFVQLGADQTVNQATLSGGTGLAGTYPITEATRLSQILKAPGALGQSPYTMFGIVARRDSRTLMRTLSAFTPLAVLNGSEDLALQTDDVVRVLSVDELGLLVTVMQDYTKKQLAQQEALRNPAATANRGNDRRQYPPGTQNQPGAQNYSSSSVAAALASSADSNPPQGDAMGRTSAGLAPWPPAAVSQNGPAFAQGDSFRNGNSGNDAQQFGMEGQQQFPPANPQPGFANPQTGAGAYPRFSQQQQPYAQQRLPLGDAQQRLQPDLQQRLAPQDGYALNREVTRFEQLAQQLNVTPIVLMNFLMDNRVLLTGAVRGPGLYLVGPSVALQDLVTAAGGTVNWTDASGVELITTAVDSVSGRAQTNRSRLALNQSLASYIVRPRDEIRFNPVFTDNDIGSVMLQGEVRFTGSYRLIRGERLSDLLARAGGLTNSAYPYGTVFLRKSVAALERDGYVRTAKEVEDQLVGALTRPSNNRLDPGTFTSLQSFVSDLRNQQPLGRVSIVADPSILASRRDLDPLLEPDDVIYIPQRPSTISVLGQVMQPGSFPYRSGESVRDYIARAGGYGRFADESQTFIILPDGTARKVERSWLRFDVTTLPPGSAIVVPRDLSPFDLRQTLIDMSQILSQFAVSIASVAVLSRQ